MERKNLNRKISEFTSKAVTTEDLELAALIQEYNNERLELSIKVNQTINRLKNDINAKQMFIELDEFFNLSEDSDED